jgi:hypothetical protein
MSDVNRTTYDYARIRGRKIQFYRGRRQQNALTMVLLHGFSQFLAVFRDSFQTVGSLSM